jgi:hypothetical protein
MNPRVDAFLDKHWRPLSAFTRMMMICTFAYLGVAVVTKNGVLGIMALVLDIIMVISLVYPKNNESQEEKA